MRGSALRSGERPALGFVDQPIRHLHALQRALLEMRCHAVGMILQRESAA
jgi:hypothetical protein